jgi:hypothetical protein
MITRAVLIVLSTLLISGLISAASQLEQRSWDAAQPWVDLAKADLAASLGVRANSIRVQGVEAVAFSNSSLGVPKPGELYLTVITPGYVIKLVTGGETYEYHAGANRVILAS